MTQTISQNEVLPFSCLGENSPVLNSEKSITINWTQYNITSFTLSDPFNRRCSVTPNERQSSLKYCRLTDIIQTEWEQKYRERKSKRKKDLGLCCSSRHCGASDLWMHLSAVIKQSLMKLEEGDLVLQSDFTLRVYRYSTCGWIPQGYSWETRSKMAF